jgi:uncharacterized membrane protein
MRSDDHNLRLLVQSVCIFFLVVSFLVSCARQPVYPAPSLKGTEVTVDVSALRPERPVFFTFRYDGKNINFFVIKVREGVLSFLDACTSCYPQKRGYRVDNAAITCRECNVRYSLSNIDKGVGNCSPIRIEGHLQGGEYHIPVSRLKEVENKF